MKNLKLILVMIAAMSMVAVSCSKDDDDTTPVDVTPNISFKGGNEYISSDATVTVGETFMIGITASSNTNSGKKLKSVTLTETSNNVSNILNDSIFSEAAYDVNYQLTMPIEGESVFKFEVTDKDGEKSSVSLTITAEPGTTALGDAEATYFERVAGAPGTGLDMFGLKWENNLKLINAVIEKDVATKFVELTSEAWAFTTLEELVEAVDAADDMDDFRGVSADANGTYDYVLGVINGGEYFMIHITKAEVVVDPQIGTTIKIIGESKK